LPTFAASLDALLGVLDVEPAYVLGHSAGAAVLVRMILDEMLAPALMVGVAAALVPFQGLAGVLFPGAARLLARTSVAPAFIAARANDEAVERVLQGTGSNLDQAALARYQRLVQQPSHIAGVLSMLSRWQPGATFDQLPSLRTPLELIAGANDLAVPMAQTQQLLARAPRARLTVVPQAGHLVHEERPEAVLSVVLKAAAIGRSDKVRQSKK
jgi:magnesium chelatase accessory protein